MDEYEWGDASVTYPDWIGTAQLDQPLGLGERVAAVALSA